MKWLAPISTTLFNMKVGELIGANLVYKGFNIVAGTGKTISLVKGFDGVNMLYINGIRISEDTELLNIVTIPDNTTGSARTDIIYAEYIHGEGAVCNYKIATNIQVVPNANCCEIGRISVPNGFSSATQITVIQAEKMPDLNMLKTMPKGSPGDLFQVHYGVGPNIKNSAGVLLIRNANDSGYADLVVNNLTVLGSNIESPTQTINTGDNYIRLNSDIAGGAVPNENAGVKIARGGMTDSVIMWDEANDVWKAGLVGTEQAIVLSNDTRLAHLDSVGRLSWSYLIGGPTSTPTNIDSAVGLKHTQNTDNTLTGNTSNTINTTGSANIVDFRVSNIIKSSIDANGKFTGAVDWAKISAKPNSNSTDIDDSVDKRHSQNTDDTLTAAISTEIRTTGAGNITGFYVGTSQKSYINNVGKYMGDVDTVDSFHLDQDVRKAAKPQFKAITVTKDGTESIINFSAETDDAGFIKHIENNDVAEMRFSVSDNSDANDKFSWGCAPSGTYAERMSLTSAGNLTVVGWINPSKVYNATVNDYAEWFLKGEEDIEPGDVLVRAFGDEEKYVKCTSNLSHLVVGVVSDSYGICLGGDNLEDMEDNAEKYAPVGLNGRVYVKVIGQVNTGDLLVTSSVPGHAMPMPVSAMVTPGMSIGCIIGKALENNADGRKKVRMMILNS
jgi:hypothetical protein